MTLLLFCVQSDNRLREVVYDLVTLQYFDYCMMMVVLLSCIQVGDASTLSLIL